jgi:hypothetical protein
MATRREAEEAAQAGMTQAVDHADRVLQQWSMSALAHLVYYARQINHPFLVEDAREWAEKLGLPVPPTKRAWGAVVRRASRGRHIAKVGHANARSSNNSPKCLWEVGKEDVV